MQSHSLESIEQEVYGSQHRDGLLDIFVGVGLLAIGISWLTDYAWTGAIVPALLVPLWRPLRSRITEPRGGRVEFGTERRRLERRKMALLFAGGVLTMLLAVAVFFWVDKRPFAWADYIAALPGVLLAAGAALVAGLFSVRRFLIYAMVLLVAGRTAVAIDVPPGQYMAEVGGFIIVVGLFLLVRFVRSNPVPDVGLEQ